MCHSLITTYQCEHKETDVFPCELSLQHPDGECSVPSPPQTIKKDGELCPSCVANKAEDDEMAEALLRIAEDDSLKPVKASSNCGKLAKTREYYPHCGHYARVTQQEFEVGADEPEYIDMEMPGSCWGCAAANPRVIADMKARGNWNEEDPWGEMSKKPLTSQEQVDLENPGGVGESSRAAAPDPVFVRDWNSTDGPSVAAEGASSRRDPRADSDLYDPEPTPGRPPPGHPAFDSSDEEDWNAGHGSDKGKGVRGRPAPARAPSYHDSEDEDEGPCHEHEAVSDPESGSPKYDSEDEDEDPPRRGRRVHRHSDPEREDRRHDSRYDSPDSDDEDEPAPPNWSTHPHPLEPSPAPNQSGEDPKALAAISDDERKRLGIGALPLTNESYQSILRRKEAEAEAAMNAHRTGALPD